ncbi:LytR C-terminal domain-containing protein [Streptomyces sp. NRRL B-24484]|uniref:LytR C-terminal domain-containing protein n=1 Tax=Streptomyces sp. NRRL B-24484 TaxID=1463833 RepID=UPI0004C2259B|nr:LytR C-terminal domain-containing protein [Streptomyces sp. NRRL B-24484]
MLTPQGLKGKQYRITGNSYPRLGRPPRRSRKVLAAIGVLLALSLVAVGGVQLYDVFRGRHASAQACPVPGASGKPLAAPASDGAAAGASPAPGATSTAVPQPQAVTVNVFNATDKSGLAARTAEELKKRGFTVGQVGNAPAALDKKVPGTVQVISGPAGLGAATLLGSQVASATRTADARTDGTVDFVIGDSFAALLDPTQAAAALAEATKPSPTPSPQPGSC